MIIGFGNNVVSSLAADITAGQTTIQVMPGAGVLFAGLLSCDYTNSSNTLKAYAKITLTDAKETVFEVCHLTSVNNDILTVVRGLEGTTAKGWALNDVIANFATRGSENQFVQIEQLQSGHYTSGKAGGTANALTLELPATYFVNGATDWVLNTPLLVYPAYDNTGASTLQLTMGGRVLGTFPLYKGNKSDLDSGDLIAGVPVCCLLDQSKAFFNVVNPVAAYFGKVRSVNEIDPDVNGNVPLAAGDVDAVSATKGGTFKADVSCTGTFTAKLLKSTSVVWAQGQVNYLPATQGAYLGWNRVSGGGTTDFINHRGGGSGGFAFWNGDGTTQTNIASISAAGGLTLKGGLAVAASSTLSGTLSMVGAGAADGGEVRSPASLLYPYGSAGSMSVEFYGVDIVNDHFECRIIVKKDSTTRYFRFKENGEFSTDGAIYEAGQRVYSPNNPPPVATNASIGESGWWKDERTGLIRQWGRVVGVVQQRVNFPIAFPTACTSVVLGQVYNSTAGQSGTARLMDWASNTGFTAFIGSAESGYYWEATGY